MKELQKNSLILLDEVGRGTSTFDGLSIAWSVTEDGNRIDARSLFAPLSPVDRFRRRNKENKKCTRSSCTQ